MDSIGRKAPLQLSVKLMVYGQAESGGVVITLLSRNSQGKLMLKTVSENRQVSLSRIAGTDRA
jgi:hypothetical protein